MTSSGKWFGLVLGAVGAAGFFSAARAGETHASLGVEGFYDHYREPDIGVNIQSDYGSVTGNFTHDWNGFFAALDGRASYGESKYDSPSGSLSSVPEWEFELRGRLGKSFFFANGTLSPYTGLGDRYYLDEGKNTYTSLGFFGYDRRINQVYLPLGLTYAYQTSGGWTIAPNIEYDQLLYGNVNSRLSNGGGPNINNTQRNGWGWRGELMIGHVNKSYSWQAGPFVRYWKVNDSEIATVGGVTGLEPNNDRTQVGLALRALW